MIFDKTLAQLKNPQDCDLRTKLYFFFRELKQQQIISGVVSGIGNSLASHLTNNQQIRGGEFAKKYTPKMFKNFDVSDVTKCKAGIALCNEVYGALPRMNFPVSRTEEVKAIYHHYFGEKLDTHPSNDYWMFRRANLPDTRNRRLQGDYLFLRTERRKNRHYVPGETPKFIDQVSTNFLRFYPHRTSGTRFMMLSIASYLNGGDRLFHGAKGWVDDVGDTELCIGQVVNRDGDTLADEESVGGATSLVIEGRQKMPYTISRETSWGYIIEAAPCLHQRVVFGQEPSLARGYIVRCNGAKGMGGTDDQSPAERYLAIKKLQEKLVTRFPRESTLPEAASQLTDLTGYPLSDFYKESKIQGSEHRQIHGLLVNIPFRGKEDNHIQNWPLDLPNRVSPSWAAKNRYRILEPGDEFGEELWPFQPS